MSDSGERQQISRRKFKTHGEKRISHRAESRGSVRARRGERQAERFCVGRRGTKCPSPNMRGQKFAAAIAKQTLVREEAKTRQQQETERFLKAEIQD